jgi:carboxymethylenebutenolidase
MNENSTFDWTGISASAPAYLALPKDGKSGPGVVVLHSFWGLNDFFKQVCDRLAKEGFAAAAPDLYNGAVASTIEEAQTLLKNIDNEKALINVIGTAEYLKSHPLVKGEGLGAVGYSLGGSWALKLSAVEPLVKAVVTYYATTEADFSRSRAAYLGHFAPLDPWEPEQDIQALEETLRGNGREVTFYTYPDTSHWFCEENRSQAYHPEAAGLAWQRTVDFLKARLST